MIEQTLAMIKPDAVKLKHVGDVVTEIEVAGFRVVDVKITVLTRAQASKLYAEHTGRHYFDELIEFTLSGSVVLLVLERENAVSVWRKLMVGSEDRTELGLRRMVGSGLRACENGLHGSDSVEAAIREIRLLMLQPATVCVTCSGAGITEGPGEYEYTCRGCSGHRLLNLPQCRLGHIARPTPSEDGWYCLTCGESIKVAVVNNL